jgi:hypothetical protein
MPIANVGRPRHISNMETWRQEVTAALRWFDGVRYRLHAYVVMNDHGHVLVEPLNDWSLQKIMHSWTSFTANRLQRLYGRPGAVWSNAGRIWTAIAGSGPSAGMIRHERRLSHRRGRRRY